jgi:hypothetical protein
MDKKANGYAAIQVMVLIAVLFMGYYVMVPIFGNIYNRFTDSTKYTERYPTAQACEGNGFWDGSSCNELNSRARDVLAKQKRTWLIVPFIFVFSLLMWYWTVASKKDYQQFGGP